MGKGGKTSTSTSTIAAPAYLQSQLEFGAQQARNLYEKGAPAYFSGPTKAGLDPVQQEALQKTLDLARAGSPLVKSAQGFAQDTLDTPSGQNPYLEAIVGKAQRDANSLVLSNFNKAGRFGSGANVETAGKAVTDASLPYLFNQFNTDQQNKFTAASMAPTFAQQDYNDAARIGTVGDVYQGQTQNGITDAFNKWQYDAAAPQNMLSNYLNSIYSSPGNKDTTTTTNTTEKSGSALSNTLQGIAGIASMFVPGGQFAALGMGAMGGLSGVGQALSGVGMANVGGRAMNTIANGAKAGLGYYGPGF